MRKLHHVSFVQSVPVSKGYPIKDNFSGSQHNIGAIVEMSDEPPWWVFVRCTDGATGVTTIFNVLSRAVDDNDIEAMTAPRLDALKPSPSPKPKG